MEKEQEWNYFLDGCDRDGNVIVLDESSGYGVFPVIHKCKLNHIHGVKK